MEIRVLLPACNSADKNLAYEESSTMSIQKKSLLSNLNATKKALVATSPATGSATAGAVKPAKFRPGTIRPGVIRPGVVKPGVVRPATLKAGKK